MLTELKDSKRKFVLFLSSGPKTIYDVREHFKVSDRRIRKVSEDLNHMGLISTRQNRKGEREFILDENKVKIRHETDKFVPDLLLIIGTVVASLFISLATGLVFVFGAIFAVVISTFRIMYKIFRTSDTKRVFAITEDEKEAEDKKNLPYAPSEK